VCVEPKAGASAGQGSLARAPATAGGIRPLGGALGVPPRRGGGLSTRREESEEDAADISKKKPPRARSFLLCGRERNIRACSPTVKFLEVAL